MTSTIATLHKQRQRLGLEFHLRTDVFAVAMVGLAWTVTLVGEGHVGGALHSGHHGMSATNSSSVLSGSVGIWVVMVIAMMGPATLGALHHVAVNSLRRRRSRAVLEFVGCYLAVWTAVGLVLLTSLRWIPWTGTASAFALALAAAAAWQLAPAKRRALRACHRSLPLPASGWAAERASMLFGVRSGVACVGSCWLLMIAALLKSHAVLAMAVLTVLVTAERWSQQPRRTTRTVSAVLIVAALGTLTVAV
jgi:predicted metal-binding membrane protein